MPREMKHTTGPAARRRPTWITEAQSQAQFVDTTPCWVCLEPLAAERVARHYGMHGTRKGKVTGWRHADCTNYWTENGDT